MVMASSRPSIFSFSLYFSLFLLLLLYNKALKLWAASSYQNPPCRSNLSVSSSQKGPKEQRTKAQPGFLYRYTGTLARTAPRSEQGPPPIARQPLSVGTQAPAIPIQPCSKKRIECHLDTERRKAHEEPTFASHCGGPVSTSSEAKIGDGNKTEQRDMVRRGKKQTTVPPGKIVPPEKTGRRVRPGWTLKAIRDWQKTERGNRDEKLSFVRPYTVRTTLPLRPPSTSALNSAVCLSTHKTLEVNNKDEGQRPASRKGNSLKLQF
ncbi:uncharacterized protein LOC127666973 isoform X2 [Apodemus sylvaticus]|uniref:uncharacterized protein LOC127666973 isoform X2 n=1 Tax=Apodemus sylvaticus TaxID=10129 RepID=UPI002243DA43|nr:uncharacterized protein LOC127666973 isoform X2 [Apodemus sylvaticus]